MAVRSVWVLPRAGRALDQEHAEGRVRILPERLCGDGVQRLVRLGLDAGHVQALFVGGASEGRHRSKNSIKFWAFKSLKS